MAPHFIAHEPSPDADIEDVVQELFIVARGKLDGVLLTAPRGDDGFGYDPLFLVPSLGLTLAEIPREQKWAISHRGNAFRKLLQNLSGHSL